MTNAILMASGLGTRMKPLTDKIPKPLIKIGNKPMIETVIEALERIAIHKIYIVVGYLSEQFNYLKNKYNNIEIIENHDYKTVNNISSIYYASDVLLEDDCFICESDLYISDLNIFKLIPEYSCYFGKFVEAYSSDWVFDVNTKGYITRVGKNGKNKYNMVGLSYFTKDDVKILSFAIKNAYKKNGFENLFWDDVVNHNLNKLKLRICPVIENQIAEIDTIEELNQINMEIKNGSRKIY